MRGEQNQEEPGKYREVCWKCHRPVASCYCKYTAPVESGIKFVFLMHPKEARKQKTHAGLGGNAILRFSSGKLGL